MALPRTDVVTTQGRINQLAENNEFALSPTFALFFVCCFVVLFVAKNNEFGLCLDFLPPPPWEPDETRMSFEMNETTSAI